VHDIWAIVRDHIPEESKEIESEVEPEPLRIKEEDAQGPLRVLILGRPNVGKSTLMNHLTKSDISAVSNVAGTTRDYISTKAQLDDNIEIILTDTAGLRRPGRRERDVEWVATQKIVKKIKIGAYPRGITVSNDSAFAYVAQMGGAVIHQIDLKTFADKTIPIGPNPRALVFSPDQKTIYATLNASGKVVALDLASNKVVKTVTTGKATRSLDISTDGTALFVVNFNSATLSKIRTSDFKVLQTVKVCPDPIGVTYEPINDRTWVACYKGSIKVFDNK
jgi:YVTN family beta-propeller protein